MLGFVTYGILSLRGIGGGGRAEAAAVAPPAAPPHHRAPVRGGSGVGGCHGRESGRRASARGWRRWRSRSTSTWHRPRSFGRRTRRLGVRHRQVRPGDIKLLSVIASGLPTEDFEHVMDLETLKAPPVRLLYSKQLETRMVVCRTWMQYDGVGSAKVAVRFFVGLVMHKQKQASWDLFIGNMDSYFVKKWVKSKG
ncbi:unnamed protein product [Urochloa humidicola]